MNLWGETMPYALEDNDFIPTIEAYPAESDGAVVIFPGGGYFNRAPHEGAGYAKWLQSQGVTAFVVEYRTAPYKHPAEISDAMRAVRFVRHYADIYRINKNKIAVMGSSAGGHLIGLLSVHYDKKMYEPTDEIDKESCRPDASIFCYPVIDMGNYRHDGSRQNLLGSRPTFEETEFMSLQKQVTKDTPQAFLWHTANDNCVPIENSLMYAAALAKVNVPFELHVYPYGPHGLGLANDNPHVAQWQDALSNWLKLIEFKDGAVAFSAEHSKA